jgi:BirA family biotin operon repressor/biotin-[acetyl-CoA-carboxylase] ligase
LQQSPLKTLFIGQNAIHLKSVDSTNSYASGMLRQISLPEGSIFYTFEQTKGRGQRGNAWESEPNQNVALSLILHPAFLSAEKQFLLTKVMSLALADLMAESLLVKGINTEVKIKWPNDIYIGNKKIAGILIENILRESTIQSSIIGIGININQIVFSENLKNATSLRLITDEETDKMMIIERLCEFIEARYLRLRAYHSKSGNSVPSGNIDLDDEYLRSLYKLNSWSVFYSGEEKFEGRITDVSSAGKLCIQLHSEEIKEFDLKEVRFAD